MNVCSLIFPDEQVIDHDPFEYDELNESSRLEIYNLTISEYSKRFRCLPDADIWPSAPSNDSVSGMIEVTLRVDIGPVLGFKDIKIRLASTSALSLYEVVNRTLRESSINLTNFSLSYVNMTTLENVIIDSLHSTVNVVYKDLLRNGYKQRNMQILCSRLGTVDRLITPTMVS